MDTPDIVHLGHTSTRHPDRDRYTQLLVVDVYLGWVDKDLARQESVLCHWPNICGLVSHTYAVREIPPLPLSLCETREEAAFPVTIVFLEAEVVNGEDWQFKRRLGRLSCSCDSYQPTRCSCQGQCSCHWTDHRSHLLHSPFK